MLDDKTAICNFLGDVPIIQRKWKAQEIEVLLIRSKRQIRTEDLPEFKFVVI